MKNMMNKRFEFWHVIWILIIMLFEHFAGKVWGIDVWTLIISVGLFLVILVASELLHKKRVNASVKENLKDFISDAEDILREYKEPILERRDINNKIDKVDKVILDVFKLNYYMRKVKQLMSLGDEVTLNALSKGEKLWNNIKNEYASKEKELEYIILQSAKLTWLMELVNRNKESDDYVFPLTYNNAGDEEEYTAEELIEKQKKGQITVFFADGGYGKTWTVERMARIYAERYITSFGTKGQENIKAEFPVFVKVGDIKNISDKPICRKMKEQLYSAFSLQTLEKTNIPFEISGNDIIFVDALDESRNSKINTLIIEEMNQNQNTVIFTTRPTEIACLNELTRVTLEKPRVEYKIVDVTETQVRDYLKKELSRKQNDNELTNEEIESVLSKFENSGFAEKCTSPFLLHCFVNTVRETKKNSNEIFDIGENLNKLYGAFIAGIIEREIKGKSLRGLISVDEVLRYLNRFAIAIQGKEEKGLSGVEASELAKEYFGDADFDGRNLENAENDINISLREMHIFTVEAGKYKFISKDFMNAVIEEEQIDEILMHTSQGMMHTNDFMNFAKLKLDKFLSSKDVENVGPFLNDICTMGVNAEQVIVLLGQSMASVNLGYIQENANELYLYILIKCISEFENNRKQLHYAYEKSYYYISQYFTSWIIGKTKGIAFDKQNFENEYYNFSSTISIIQRVNELKRHLLTPKNIEYIINSYENNDYPKFLWLKDRFANYEYSVNLHRIENEKYNYPKNLEYICKNIISKIDSGFEFYDEVLEIESRIIQVSGKFESTKK